MKDEKGRDSNKGRKNKIYENIKKEIELRAKRAREAKAQQVRLRNVRVGPTSPHYCQGTFVDKQRNAAVVLGTQDLKADVKNRRNTQRQGLGVAVPLFCLKH